MLALLLLACAPAAYVSLDGPGGDAFTFTPRLTGTTSETCDEVWVESSRGRILATRDAARFAADVPLAAGANEVVAICVTGGGEHRSAAQPWNVRLADRPTARVRVRIADEGVLLEGGGSAPSEAGTGSIARYAWTARDGNPADLTLTDGAALTETGVPGESLTLATPAEDGEYYVRLTVTDTNGNTDTSVATFRVSYGEPLLVDLTDEHPDWVDGAVVYGVVPFFFGEAGFDDVTARLDALDDLGVTVLWLSPILACPDDDFGYAVTDPFTLRETFGTEADLRELIDGAHARDMRVIMDFVPNHTSDRHPYYKEQERTGAASPYHDWYDRGADGEVTYYFGWDNLPNLDYDNPEVRRYMTEAFAHWVRDFDIDGFRADVAWGVSERAPDFWAEWRAELKRIKPDLLLLAEGSGRDPTWFGHGFDAAYDWTWEPGEWAWQAAFDAEEPDVAALVDALTNEGEGFDDDALLLRFLENNDTGERFVTRHGAARVPVAAALTITVPGLPLVYTGQDVGAEFEPYDEGPVLDWADPSALTPVYQRLIRLRRDLAALRSREWALLDLGDHPSMLGYVRIAPDPAENVVVLLNFGEAAATVDVPATDDTTPVFTTGTAQDLYTDGQVRGTRVTIDGLGVRILAAPTL
ncbi:MAG: alpha-amylase family glycosyl hydrolase [Myxococcota bacterium]